MSGHRLCLSVVLLVYAVSADVNPALRHQIQNYNKIIVLRTASSQFIYMPSLCFVNQS